ncbi:MAG TPA: HD domain-containing protein [Stellaceae bacterium]|nr:HD domain-containing protein [Stellaceae bacterium]
MQAIDRLLGLLATKGGAQYGEEAISQLQHALQSAALAEAEGAPAATVAAALLHDIGHLLHKHGPSPALRGIDDRHEAIGGKALARDFGPAVAEPVRLHVAAKRWLCGADPAYFARLSPASVRSLALQGGAMREDEAAAFLARPHAEAAIRVRRWDDAAKVPGTQTPPLEHYRAVLEAALDRGV